MVLLEPSTTAMLTVSVVAACAQVVINFSIPLGTTMPIIRTLIEAEFSNNAQSTSVLRGTGAC